MPHDESHGDNPSQSHAQHTNTIANYKEQRDRLRADRVAERSKRHITRLLTAICGPDNTERLTIEPTRGTYVKVATAHAAFYARGNPMPLTDAPQDGIEFHLGLPEHWTEAFFTHIETTIAIAVLTRN